MAAFVDLSWKGEGGLTLYARDYAGAGGSARCPVICIHGLTRNYADFEEVAPWIAALGRRVIAVDVRGRRRAQRQPQPGLERPTVSAADPLAPVARAPMSLAALWGP